MTKLKRAVLFAAALILSLAGCSAPSSFDGYVHTECGATTTNANGDKVTTCSATQKPIPTQTVTVTAAPPTTAAPSPVATTPAPAPSTASPTPTAAPTTAAPAPAGTAPVGGPAGNWTLKFNDDFNGTAIDTTKWSPSWFGGGTMNHVATPSSNVSVHDGAAWLTLSDSGHGALISTNPNGGAKPGYTFTNGYIEARILFPGSGTNGCHNWPAFWTDGQSWPTNGENDIAEVLSGQMTVNYHSGGPNSKNQGAVPGVWCGGWHTYGLYRTAGHAEVYYDGQLVKSYATDELAPQYIIVNVGTGSNAVYGAASQVAVDYVRGWQ